MFNPVSTYRIQFHKGFTLSDFEKLIPYFEKLGAGTIYASPLFAATPGSTHGYDSINAHEINPEIGTDEQFKQISKKLRAKGISWLQDIVPNHMAYHPDNAWLMDVLEKGERSVYASYFDFVQPLYNLHENKIMVPFLGDDLAQVIERGELQLQYTDAKLRLKYFDSAYPVNSKTYVDILNSLKKEWTPSFITELEELNAGSLDALIYSQAFDGFLSRLNGWYEDTNLSISADLEEQLAIVNQNKDLLLQIAEQQFYRLCHWQETDERINFRRFFTVNGLICLNIQHPEVFEDYHKVVIQLFKDGMIQGIRLDHIDGLFDPKHYLQQLRALVGPEAYIVAEKILEKGENFPEHWPIQGNTGYDFLALLNNLYTRKDQEDAFSRFYNNLSGDTEIIEAQLLQKKRHILNTHMQGELQNLHDLFLLLKLGNAKFAETTPEELKAAIGEFLIHFPVYRCYGNQYPLPEEDRIVLEGVFKEMRKQLVGNSAIDLLESIFLHSHSVEGQEEAILQFYQRCMQFTGPLMAKGVEDTLMYTYSRFIGHNEVGDSPEAFGISISDFHQKMMERQEKWPLSINTTSTHDTKRGEDARARLNVLSNITDEWTVQVDKWQEANQIFKKNAFPDQEDEYFIYQTIVGSYPMPGEDKSTYESRLHAYLEKAFREAKKHSNWAKPNEAYEQAAKNFASAILEEESDFYKQFNQFQKKIVDAGIINSLGQVVLKFTCPGVPDVYQGSEYWDLSFVDPDNRQPVNYALRSDFIDSLESHDFHTLWTKRYSGKIKLWLTRTLLHMRQQDPNCFGSGIYHPLEIKGKYKDRVIAFERKWKNNSYITIVPLALPNGATDVIAEIAQLDWEDTSLVLPNKATQFQNVLINQNDTQDIVKEELSITELFQELPVAVLKLVYPEKERNAGVLLPITSLATSFGIGDIGPSAFRFVDYLQKGLQSYWQVLPLTPTEEANGHSPYSSFSSLAGNTALISPEALESEGLLEKADLRNYHISNTNIVAYAESIFNKAKLLDKAYDEFSQRADTTAFEIFCDDEHYWLHDFAMYVLIKNLQQGKPWYEWPNEYKTRMQEHLDALLVPHAAELQKIKWLQYVFFKQWHSLKQYCRKSGVQLIGDLPFYVSYDSVDVWVTPELFALDENLNPKYIAGVPPDYFNADGQLWGMPVFNWDEVKQQGFKWWIKRINKNLELFDVLRLDHFRAFAAYWEVAANESTAKNGTWIKAPGYELFDALKQEFGDLPFLAEDLGDIDEDVHGLRNHFNMPGMKVLQFAFGDSLATSEYAPHNYQDTNSFVYTGTHDNNTIKGWYKQDIDDEVRQQINEYTGANADENNVHEILIKLAYASIAKTVIIPMQDILGLDQACRMNIPASAQGNWQWRLKGDEDLLGSIEKLKQWTKLYNRV